MAESEIKRVQIPAFVEALGGYENAPKVFKALSPTASWREIKDGWNAYWHGGDSNDLSDIVGMQDFLNQFGISSAKQQWEAQAKADQIAMNFSASEAQKLRDWQTEMSNTAYERQVSDMKKAGINPVLSAANGGASVPAGSAGSGVSSARQAAQLNLENYVYLFENLVRSLEQSGKNAKTNAASQVYSATVNAAANVFGSIVNSGALSSSGTGKIGFT